MREGLVDPLLEKAQILATVLEQVRTDEPDAVHQLRVNGRRINVGLWVLGRATSRAAVLDLRDDVRWLTTIAGRVRDLEVIASQLEGEFAAVATAERLRELLPLLEVLADQRSRALPLNLRKALSEFPARQVSRSATKASRTSLRRADERMRTALDQFGGPDPPDQALHAIRKTMRRARYVAEVAAPALGDDATAYAKALAGVQETLGRHQDASVALSWLHAHRAALPPADGMVERLIAVQSEARAAFDPSEVPGRPRRNQPRA